MFYIITSFGIIIAVVCGVIVSLKIDKYCQDE